MSLRIDFLFLLLILLFHRSNFSNLPFRQYLPNYDDVYLMGANACLQGYFTKILSLETPRFSKILSLETLVLAKY